MKNDIKHIFCVIVLFVHRKTEEDLQKGYTLYKLKMEKEISFEQYLKILKSEKRDIFAIAGENSSYHRTLEKAKYFAENNIGDISETGVYNYFCISKIPLGCVYYPCYQDVKNDFILYEYDYPTKIAKLVDKDSEEYKHIVNYVWGNM